MKKLFKTLHYYLVVKQSKWNLLIVIIPGIIFYIYISYIHSFVETGNYTIGYIDKIYWPIITHKKVSYIYTVNRIKKSGSNVYDDDANPKEHGYYLVQFSLKDNSVSKIFQGIPVPDSIKSAPPGGWKEMPEWAKNSKRR